MGIGKASITGRIGKAGKISGKFGTGSGTQGSSIALGTNYCPLYYPTTTTSSSSTTTSSSSTTTSSSSTTTSTTV